MVDRKRVQAVLKVIKRYADYETFFNELSSPDWIEPLAAEGMFTDPPEATREGKYITFALWPESRYLVRMAESAPREVLRTALAIPVTGNVRVHEDLTDIANALPIKLAVKLVPRVRSWLESPYLLLLPEKAARLMARLGAAQQIGAAESLARALFAISPRSSTGTRQVGGEHVLPPEAEGRIHEWEYGRMLEKYLPSLRDMAPMKTLLLLSDLLEQAVSISRPNATNPEDYSHIWRSEIDCGASDLHGDIRNHLVSALRDAALFAVERLPTALTEVIETLDKRQWNSFQLLAQVVWE